MVNKALSSLYCGKGKNLRTYAGQSVLNIHVTILMQSTGVIYIHECFSNYVINNDIDGTPKI